MMYIEFYNYLLGPTDYDSAERIKSKTKSVSPYQATPMK